jgi:hypothetical protein
MNSFSTLPSRRVLLLPERVVRVEQNITMQGGKIYHGVVVQSNVAPGESIEERIRQIVREEVSAQLNKEGVCGTANQFITDQGIYTGRIISEVRHA